MRFLCFGKRGNERDKRKGAGAKEGRKADGTEKRTAKESGKPGGAGRKRGRRAFPCLYENALFWIFLVLLSVGCVTRLYQKAALKPASSGQALFAVRKEAGTESGGDAEHYTAGQGNAGGAEAEHDTAGQGNAGGAEAGRPAGGNRNYRAGDRNLPIYCVETDKPQVALSFDAAWGGGHLRQAAGGQLVSSRHTVGKQPAGSW